MGSHPSHHQPAKKSEHAMEKARVSGWAAVLGCSSISLAVFRISLGSLLSLELVLRYRFLDAFYSDNGTLPKDLLLGRVDDLYQIVCCLHCHFGSLLAQQVLLTIQVACAISLTIGYRTRLASILSWYLYLSLTLRNTWLSYILDRYFHYLLFLSMFLPLDEHWSVQKRASTKEAFWVISPATIALKGLILWIYYDAGMGKYLDPQKGWSFDADPLPALDTYARHTLPAQYLYALLGSHGLRCMTPIVVYIELAAAPLALAGQFFNLRSVTILAIALVLSLHMGIAITLRNSTLLSLVAGVAWAPLLPIVSQSSIRCVKAPSVRYSIASILLIGGMLAGSLWLETISQVCDQSVKHIWSTLLHNRWNVFVGAEEYVTWEIAPGLLQDGTIVDVWGRREEVNWNLPGGGAPCTATARPGRWRSFPYLAELEGAEGDALWGYLCKEWDNENNAAENPGRKLVKYNFFMLQADVMPEMRFSATQKRLVKTYECASSPTQSKSISDPDKGDEIDHVIFLQPASKTSDL
jgi:hypothetical protein